MKLLRRILVLNLFDSSFFILYGALLYLLGLICIFILTNHWYEIDSKITDKKIKYQIPGIGKKFFTLYNETFKTLFYFLIAMIFAPKIALSVVTHNGVVEDLLLNIFILSISIVEAFFKSYIVNF